MGLRADYLKLRAQPYHLEMIVEVAVQLAYLSLFEIRSGVNYAF
jgi:hypothetical protein